MLTFNRIEFTKQAIQGLFYNTRFPYVLTVVDNNSRDGTRDYLRTLKEEGIIKNVILLDKNIGVKKASNLAWHCEPDAEYYVKLDNDIVIQKRDWLMNMVEIIDAIPFIGVIGYNVEPVSYPLQTIKGYPVRLKYRNIGGACILIPKRTEKKLGYWCEEYGLYGEADGDYGVRTELLGLSNVYMEDEHIGIHLPAGKGAKIDFKSFCARDGVEEKIDKQYRNFKDKHRIYNQGKEGMFKRNVHAYRSFRKPYYCESLYAKEQIKMPRYDGKHSKIKKKNALMKAAFSNLKKMLREKKRVKLGTLDREYYFIGKLYLKNYEYQKARKYFKQALALTSDLVTTEKYYSYLVFIEKKLGNKEKELFYYKKGLAALLEEEDKRNIDRYRVASLFKKIKNYDESYRWFKKIIMNTNEGQEILSGAYFHLGEIAYIKKDFKQAHEYFTACLRLNSHHKKARGYREKMKCNMKANITQSI